MVAELAKWKNVQLCNIYTSDELKDISVPNPSEKVRGCDRCGGGSGKLCVKSIRRRYAYPPKSRRADCRRVPTFTFAVSIDRDALRGGHIEIVGAGPGDPDLVSVRGRKFLERADLILYAGSLVPKDLTHSVPDRDAW